MICRTNDYRAIDVAPISRDGLYLQGCILWMDCFSKNVSPKNGLNLQGCISKFGLISKVYIPMMYCIFKVVSGKDGLYLQGLIVSLRLNLPRMNCFSKVESKG